MASPLYEHALKLLAHRPHSRTELRQKLTRLVLRPGRKRPVSYTLQDVDGALEALTTTGQLDDAEFAAWYREQRQRFRPRAAVVLRQELRSKMVPEPYISAQLAMYDEEEACRRAALKKAHYDEHRLRMYLLRNGYGMGLVRGTVEWMREQRAPVPGGPEHARPEYWEQQAEAAAAGGQPSDESSDSGDDEADGDGDAGVRAAARPRPAGFVRGRASRIKSKVRDPMFDGEGEV